MTVLAVLPYVGAKETIGPVGFVAAMPLVPSTSVIVPPPPDPTSAHPVEVLTRTVSVSVAYARVPTAASAGSAPATPRGRLRRVLATFGVFNVVTI